MRFLPGLCLFFVTSAVPVFGDTWNDACSTGCEVLSDIGQAFPGAQGFGAVTAGGRCGEVYVVDKLTDTPAAPQDGELRWALEGQTGCRTIVFATGGEIKLEDAIWRMRSGSRGRTTLT